MSRAKREKKIDEQNIYTTDEHFKSVKYLFTFDTLNYNKFTDHRHNCKLLRMAEMLQT